MRRKRLLICAAGTVLLAGAGAVPASAAAATPTPQLHVIRTITNSVIGPLQFKVVGAQVYVADDFTGTLSIVGRKTPLATAPAGDELAGIGVDRYTRAYAYTTNNQAHTQASLTIVAPGAKPVVADLYAYEKTHNPDSKNTYGILGAVSSACSAELQKAGLPQRNTGEVDTHPYAVAPLGYGQWAVADAGGNDILRVDRYGHVSLLAVLPPQPVKVTKAFAAAVGAPDCVGATYRLEPVPTDVETGPDGSLLVTTLPGGPEAPGSGAHGSVYRIVCNGRAEKIATGFNGATNLAVDRIGDIFVSEIFSGTITEVPRYGQQRVVATLPYVVAVDWENGHLYASTSPAAASDSGPNSPPPPPTPGSVVELGPGQPRT